MLLVSLFLCGLTGRLDVLQTAPGLAGCNAGLRAKVPRRFQARG